MTLAVIVLACRVYGRFLRDIRVLQSGRDCKRIGTEAPWIPQVYDIPPPSQDYGVPPCSPLRLRCTEKWGSAAPRHHGRSRAASRSWETDLGVVPQHERLRTMWICGHNDQSQHVAGRQRGHERPHDCLVLVLSGLFQAGVGDDLVAVGKV